MKDDDPRIIAAREFAKSYDPDPAHAAQVAMLSLALFDELASLHGLGKRPRMWLHAAAFLHDIGYATRPDQHHKGSRDLIASADIKGFSRAELQLIACVARYHRKGLPERSHKVFRDLEAAEQSFATCLASLLRIADGLDRCHRASVESVTAARDSDGVSIRVRQRFASPEDLAAAQKKADLFEKTFGLPVKIASA